MILRGGTSVARAARRWYCTKDWMSEIDDDMVKEKARSEKAVGKERPPEWKGWDDFKEHNWKYTGVKGDLSGHATEKGIELYFSGRKVKRVGEWGKQIPGTSLRISPVTHSLKRMNHHDSTHLAAVMRSFESGINAFELHVTSPDGVNLFYKALREATSRGYSRSGLVIIARVGWVTFDHWSAIDCVAPDFAKIPNSREISTYGRDFTLPPIKTKNYVSIKKGGSSLSPDVLGETLDARYRFFIPGQPNIDVQKITEGALFKLAGLITVNKKLSSYWSGAPQILRSQVESILSGGITCADFVIIDSVHIAKAVANSDEEFVLFLTESFAELEAMGREGLLQYYGVESDRFWGGSETKDFIDLRLVLQAAKNAGGDRHRFRIVSQPFNLTERGGLLSKMADDYPKTVFDFIKENELGSMTSRPLATYDHEGKEQRYVNHSRVADVGTMTKNVASGIEECAGMEHVGVRLMENIVMQPHPMLYSLGGSLAAASKFLNNYYMFDLFMNFWFREMAGKCFDLLGETKDTVIMKWVGQYRQSFDKLETAYSVFLQNIHAIRDEKILAGIEGCLTPDIHLGIELPQMALNSILSTNVMHSVTVGLRLNIYVDACVARNPTLLEPLPVSVIGRLFTEPETSFQERQKERRYTVTTPEEIANMPESEVSDRMEKNYQKTGLVGEIVVQDGDEDVELPSWVKRVD